WPDQQPLPSVTKMRCITAKRDNSRRKALDDMQDQRIRRSHDFHGSPIFDNSAHLVFNLSAWFYGANHNRRACPARNNVGRFPTMKHTNVECSFTENAVVAPIRSFAIFQDLKQVPDRGSPHLWITRVSSPASQSKVHHERTLLRSRELVLRRFADD